jgi:hypothetical protein
MCPGGSAETLVTIARSGTHCRSLSSIQTTASSSTQFCVVDSRATGRGRNASLDESAANVVNSMVVGCNRSPIFVRSDLFIVIVLQRSFWRVVLRPLSRGSRISHGHRSHPYPRSPARPACHPTSESPLRSPSERIVPVSEKKDISRQRLADFLAARLRARANPESESQRSRNESSSMTMSRPDEHATPATES